MAIDVGALEFSVGDGFAVLERRASSAKRVRAPIDVELSVQGWNLDRLIASDIQLAYALDIVAEGYFFGLSVEESEVDIVENTNGCFESAELNMVAPSVFELHLIPSPDKPDI